MFAVTDCRDGDPRAESELGRGEVSTGPTPSSSTMPVTTIVPYTTSPSPILPPTSTIPRGLIGRPRRTLSHGRSRPNESRRARARSSPDAPGEAVLHRSCPLAAGFHAGAYDPGMDDDGEEIAWPACPSCLTLLTISERLHCKGCGLVVL